MADTAYEAWATEPVIDILMQVYGDAAVLDAIGAPKNYNFLEGQLPELANGAGGSLPVEAKNKQWDWVLFSITNNVRASDGLRLVGTIATDPPAQGAIAFGGVNGGTLRLGDAQDLKVRVIAWAARRGVRHQEPNKRLRVRRNRLSRRANQPLGVD